MESALVTFGALVLLAGVVWGWFCYSRVSADTVEKASYLVAHGLFPSSSMWLLGSIVGLGVMIVGMVLMFVGLIGVGPVKETINWFQTVFG